MSVHLIAMYQCCLPSNRSSCRPIRPTCSASCWTIRASIRPSSCQRASPSRICARSSSTCIAARSTWWRVRWRWAMSTLSIIPNGSRERVVGVVFYMLFCIRSSHTKDRWPTLCVVWSRRTYNKHAESRVSSRLAKAAHGTDGLNRCRSRTSADYF